MQAQDKADAILEDANARAEMEKAKLEQALESERERIIDIKRDVKSIKTQVVDMLTKYQSLMSEVEAYIETKESEYNEKSGEEV